MASEKLRHREVHKYYQSWLDSSIAFNTASTTQLSRYHGDGSRIRHSQDKALIAFAQLGCLRLDAKRAVVTLISTDQQFILAEATKTLSLVSGDGDSGVQDQIWFGVASLPRSQGISGDAISPPDYTATDAGGQSFTAPALVVNDLTCHENYHSRPYVGKGVTFYCGVPIKTDCGVPIGVYTVTDDKPRNGLTISELRFLCDMASVVMRHLDVVSNEAARFRGETMVLGLGRFISGAPSLYDEGVEVLRAATPTATPDLVSTEVSSERMFKGLTITAAGPSKIQFAPNEMKSPTSKSMLHSRDASASSNYSGQKEFFELGSNEASVGLQVESEVLAPQQKPAFSTTKSESSENRRPTTAGSDLFSRAASILRECVAADGVLFFDAVSTNFTKRANVEARSPVDERPDPNILSPKISFHGISDSKQALEKVDNALAFSSGASEESDAGGLDDNERRMCRLLGYSLDTSSHSSASPDMLDDVQMTERSLGRLVRMYPQGKLFSFHVESGYSASDGEHLTEDVVKAARPTKSRRLVTSDKSRRIPRIIAEELERLIPQAQSIIWLPLWDFSKQRWNAGLFLWSRRPDRLITAQDDLVYLKAFANSIMVEVARRDAAAADTAKSTFIANISHELRTPLHGILGNLDILQDTKLSNFQHSLLTAIEVCGRTLSDTIDHVLDHSKINQLSKHSRKRNKSSSIPLPSLSYTSKSSDGTSLTEEDFDISTIVEEAVEATYASHAFQSTDRTRLRAGSLTGNQHPAPQAVPPQGPPKVHVILNFEPRDSWWVRSQPSAIRRVVSNILGNALKYTDQGTIQISLASTQSIGHLSGLDATIPIILVIKDTGRGMSPEFVRNHAFVPFSQESQFSTGIGLGLSIVQQIVKSLGGKIELWSDQGVGTEIKVLLNLPASSKVEQTTQNLASLRETQAGISMSIQTAEDDATCSISPGMSLAMSSIEVLARSWFNITITNPGLPREQTPLIMVYVTPPTGDQLQAVQRLRPLSNIGFIVLAANTIEKAALTNLYAGLVATAGPDIDVLSYPIGPNKFGQALSKYIDNVKGNQKVDISRNDRAISSLPSNSTTPEALATPSTSNECATISRDGPEPHNAINHSQLSLASFQVSDMPMSTPEMHENQFPPSVNEDSIVDVRAEVPILETIPRQFDSPSGSDVRSAPILPRSMSEPSPHVSTDDEKSTPVRVLLVDDNEINLNILKTCMKRARIPFDFAKDGLEASNAFQHAHTTKSGFTHVLMDINMPVMDGIQSTREIREFETRQNSLNRISRTNESVQSLVDVYMPDVDVNMIEDQTPVTRAFVVALSGVASEAAQFEMLEAGADMFLPKPVKLKELLKILRT